MLHWGIMMLFIAIVAIHEYVTLGGYFVGLNVTILLDLREKLIVAILEA